MSAETLKFKSTLDDSQFEAILERMARNSGVSAATMSKAFQRAGAQAAASLKVASANMEHLQKLGAAVAARVGNTGASGRANPFSAIGGAAALAFGEAEVVAARAFKNIGAGMSRLQQNARAAASRLEAGGSNAVRGIGSTLLNPVSGLAGAISAGFAAESIVTGIKQIFDAGRALQQLSRETGASTAGLAQLQMKFRDAGLDGDALTRSMFRLQKTIAGEEDEENTGGVKRLRELAANSALADPAHKLNLAALQRMPADKQLLAVGEAISRLYRPTERTAAAMLIFGKAGAELGAVFNKDFADTPPNLTRNAQTLARNSALFEEVSIKLGRVANIGKTFYLGAATGLARGLTPLLDRLEKVDLVGMGQRFGAALAEGAKKLTDAADSFKKVDLAGEASKFADGLKAGASAWTDAFEAIKKTFGSIPNILGLSGPNSAGAQGPAAASAANASGLAGTGFFGSAIHQLLEAAGYHGGKDVPAPSSDDTPTTDPVVVDDRTSLFRTQGMQFKSPGMQFKSPGMTFKNVFDETRGGALDMGATRPPTSFTDFDDDRARLGLESGLHTGLAASRDALERGINSGRGYTGAFDAVTQGGLGGGAYGKTGGGASGASIWTQISGRVGGNSPKDLSSLIAQTNTQLDILNQKMQALNDVWGAKGGSGASGGGATAGSK